MTSISFTMGDADYHANPALSKSKLFTLSQSAFVFWKKYIACEEVIKSSDAFEFGRQYHTLILEPEKFYSIYSADKADVDKHYITPAVYGKLKAMASVFDYYPAIKKKLNSGYPEVSVFFKYKGHDFKARFDCATVDAIIDLKTISFYSGSFDDAIMRQVHNFGYHCQEYLYQKAREEVTKAYSKGGLEILGEISPEQEKWLKDFCSNEMPLFTFVFQNKAEPFEIKGKILNDEQVDIGRQRIEDMLEQYEILMNKFGEISPWVDESFCEIHETPNYFYY